MEQRLHIPKFFCATFLLLFFFSTSFAQQSISIEASKDNTLYEQGEGATSNGVGTELFTGNIDRATNALRRALIQFDLSQIPAGATIESATLNIFVSKIPPGAGATPSTLHKITSDWGEGTSNAGTDGGKGTFTTDNDATWIHTFSPGSTWTTPGGDFEATASANTELDGVGAYSYSGEGMVADVQAWLDDADSNFGWMIRGNEGVRLTARKLVSRESAIAERRPTLVVTYTGGTSTNIDDVQTVSLRVFPNPSIDGKIRVEADGLTVGTVSMSVINLVGQQLINQEVSVLGGRIGEDIDLSNWGSGIYFIHFKTESGTRTQKVIVR
ncbi:MAG: DNRLRE domain-containing protein [Bacteroidota bacterium]